MKSVEGCPTPEVRRSRPNVPNSTKLCRSSEEGRKEWESWGKTEFGVLFVLRWSGAATTWEGGRGREDARAGAEGLHWSL
jgi:hypothetical protein